MLVQDIMTRGVVTVTPDALITTATALMLAKGVSGLPVVAYDGTLAGILTEGDLLHRSELGTQTRHPFKLLRFILGPGRDAMEYVASHSRRVADLMTQTLVTVEATADLREAVNLMEKHRIRHVPVMRDGSLAGIVSRLDLVRALHQALVAAAPAGSNLECETRLRDEIAAQAWAPGLDLQVTVSNDVVTLQGVVFDGRTRDALLVAASNLAPGRRIDDQLLWRAPYVGLILDGAGTD